MQRQLRLLQLRFRIGAPAAAQWAALEKDVGAHARAVVHGHALHVEHNAAHGFHLRLLHTVSNSVRRMISSRIMLRSWSRI
jgi:hypothetical protein